MLRRSGATEPFQALEPFTVTFVLAALPEPEPRYQPSNPQISTNAHPLRDIKRETGFHDTPNVDQRDGSRLQVSTFRKLLRLKSRRWPATLSRARSTLGQPGMEPLHSSSFKESRRSYILAPTPNRRHTLAAEGNLHHRERELKVTTSTLQELGYHYMHVSPPSGSTKPVHSPSTPSKFDEHQIPTADELAQAADICVVAESGVHIRFGDLLLDQKKVVVFVRHFWCPFCQDYMASISRSVDLEALQKADVSLIIISNGSHKTIKSYRRIFQTPSDVFADSSLMLYEALRMTLCTVDPGPEASKGAYVRHGTIRGIGMVLSNALRANMSLVERGGTMDQLGGEFILGPGALSRIKCETHDHTCPYRRFSEWLVCNQVCLEKLLGPRST